MAHDLKHDITAQIIEPNIHAEFAETYKWRNRWKRIANLSRAAAEIFVLIGAIISFAAAYWDVRFVSFIAGCMGSTAIALDQYAAVANRNYDAKVHEIITMSSHIGIDNTYIPPTPRLPVLHKSLPPPKRNFSSTRRAMQMDIDSFIDIEPVEKKQEQEMEKKMKREREKEKKMEREIEMTSVKKKLKIEIPRLKLPSPTSKKQKSPPHVRAKRDDDSGSEQEYIDIAIDID